MKRVAAFLLVALLPLSPVYAWQGFVVDAVPAVASTAPDITTGLIAWLKLDETSGTSAADSAGSHTGTTFNLPTWANPGLTFDGFTQYCTLASPPIIGDRTAFTISVWFKTTQTTAGDIYEEGRSISNTSQIYIGVNINAAGDIKFGYLDGTGASAGTAFSALNPNDGNWHQIVFVQSAKNSRTFYFDGSSIGTNATSIGALSLDLSTIAAANRSGSISTYFNGTEKNFRAYNIALNSTQINYLFTNGL